MPGARVHDPQKIKVSFAGRDLGQLLHRREVVPGEREPRAGAAARELISVLDEKGRQIAPFSSRDPAFGLADAYRITPVVRSLREAGLRKVLAGVTSLDEVLSATQEPT